MSSPFDDDLGRSGSGLVERPGFQRLVADVCTGEIGAVFCIEASRLARNGRDWHHLIELCGMVGTVVVDADGVYDPNIVNDRLLLGLKGTMSEFELNLLRQRSREAIQQKASRGELQFLLPVGLGWTASGKMEKDPDQREHHAEPGAVQRPVRHDQRRAGGLPGPAGAGRYLRAPRPAEPYLAWAGKKRVTSRKRA